MITLASTNSDTERLLKGSLLLEAEKNAHKKTALKLDTHAKMLADWVSYFEIDFRAGEYVSYSRMRSYLDTIKVLRTSAPYFIGDYREKTIKEVKERMSEVKI